MKNILIFGGTIEGRLLVEYLMSKQVNIYVCVATEYGGSLLPKTENVKVLVGRMDENDMEQILMKISPDCCIDVTHPYAVMVTENIAQACKNTNTKYMRVLRGHSASDSIAAKDTKCCECDGDVQVELCGSVDAAAQFLIKAEGNIFITTGSKELEKYTCIPNYRNRCFARVLPTVEVMQKCASLGFEGKNLICMQGPFSQDLNYAMFKQTGANWLVTKSTGKEGGYQDKCEAALRAGVNILVVGRPVEHVENIVSFEEAKSLIGAMLETDFYRNNVGKCMGYDLGF